MALTTARLWAYASGVVGTGYYKCLTGTASDNFGATPTVTAGDNTDWNTTQTYLESTIEISSTGWQSWDVDPAHIDLSNYTWFCLKDAYENNKSYTQLTVRSAEAGSNIPYLELIFSSGHTVDIPLGTITAATQAVLATLTQDELCSIGINPLTLTPFPPTARIEFPPVVSDVTVTGREGEEIGLTERQEQTNQLAGRQTIADEKLVARTEAASGIVERETEETNLIFVEH